MFISYILDFLMVSSLIIIKKFSFCFYYVKVLQFRKYVTITLKMKEAPLIIIYL